MASGASSRLGRYLVLEDGDTVYGDDLQQAVRALASGLRVVADALGGPGLLTGGAAALADLEDPGNPGRYTHYPACRLIVPDDAGYPWPKQTTAPSAITFEPTAGAVTLHAVLRSLASVDPPAGDGALNGVSFLARLTADPAPAASWPLGTGTVATGAGVTAFTAYTPAAEAVPGPALLQGLALASGSVVRSTGLAVGFRGADLAPGVVLPLAPLPWDATGIAWRLYADAPLTAQVDVWTDAGGVYPPTDADSLPGAGQEPSITAAASASGTTAGWARTSLPAGAVPFVRLDSVTPGSATWLMFALTVRKANDG